MPAHCSGDLAKELFRELYWDSFEPLGAEILFGSRSQYLSGES